MYQREVIIAMSSALAVRDFQLDAPEDDVSVAEVPIRLTLAQMRKRKRMTALALAHKAGVAPTTIQNIEQKGRVPRYGTIEKLAIALDVDPEDIIWPGDPLGLGDPQDS